MPYIFKQLNIETWPLDYVLDWLSGISAYSESYTRSFEARAITGRKLAILELTDLKEILASQDVSLNRQITVFRSIQSLLQLRHDLNKDTLHTILFSTHTRVLSLLNYIRRLENCACTSDCDRCTKYKRYEIVSAASGLAQAYRRLIAWLVRIPFARLKPFEVFREDINKEMKSLLRLLRRRPADCLYAEMKARLQSMLECCAQMLDYCDRSCEKENGKVAVAYSCCYLAKVYLRRTSGEQVLGLRLTTLSDGVYTVAEIIRGVGVFLKF